MSVVVEFADIFVPLVDLAVGFCVGREGNGDEVGLPAADELPGGEGGDGRGEEDEGTEGGDMDSGGEFVVGAGEVLGLDGGGGG